MNKKLSIDEFDKNLADQEVSKNNAILKIEAMSHIPIKIAVVLGMSKLTVDKLLKLEIGDIVEIDRKVGEAVDIYANNRLVARGEIVELEGQLGVTMTEIVDNDANYQSV